LRRIDRPDFLNATFVHAPVLFFARANPLRIALCSRGRSILIPGSKTTMRPPTNPKHPKISATKSSKQASPRAKNLQKRVVLTIFDEMRSNLLV
jgi:hypothetical protein